MKSIKTMIKSSKLIRRIYYVFIDSKITIYKSINGNRLIVWLKEYKKISSIAVKPFRRKKYYIIRYDDPMSSGWTVWERVVLYNSLYAEEHGMIPVVDMRNRNIYLEENEIGIVNAWEKYYLQPGGVLLDEALASGDYCEGSSSYEWFCYIRKRHPYKYSNEYLRKKFNEYVIWKPETVKKIEDSLSDNFLKHRILTLCLRGTDYKEFHHPKQPTVKDISLLANRIFSEYKCDSYYIATEDKEIYNELLSQLPPEFILNDGKDRVSCSKGYIGEVIRRKKTAEEAALDYLTVLFIMNKSVCLIGGVSGATIVAKYRRKTPYEYINILNTHESY